jgi:hypothetical protein
MLQFSQPADHFFVRLFVAPHPERIVGIAIFEPELAPGLDNAMLCNIHGSRVHHLTIDRTTDSERI